MGFKTVFYTHTSKTRPWEDIGMLCRYHDFLLTELTSHQVHAILRRICNQGPWEHGTYVWDDQSSCGGSAKWCGGVSDMDLDCGEE